MQDGLISMKKLLQDNGISEVRSPKDGNPYNIKEYQKILLKILSGAIKIPITSDCRELPFIKLIKEKKIKPQSFF